MEAADEQQYGEKDNGTHHTRKPSLVPATAPPADTPHHNHNDHHHQKKKTEEEVDDGTLAGDYSPHPHFPNPKQSFIRVHLHGGENERNHW
jgi:hypothetical protein